jgi:hypothetical protein
LLDPIIRSSSVSFGMQRAFEDFRTALRTGGASIDHRFWRLIGRARRIAGQQETPLAVFKMEFDEDGDRQFRLATEDGAYSELFFDIGKAAATKSMVESPNLGPSIRRGILFFSSTGLASWTAAGEPPVGSGKFHLAISKSHGRFASWVLDRFQQSGNWFISIDPIPSPKALDIIESLGIRNANESVQRIGLVDGVHVGKAWLGQFRFLPHVQGAIGPVEVVPVAGSSPPFLKLNEGKLECSSPVDGEYVISDKAGGWSRRYAFVPLAEVHALMEGANYSLAMLEEWRTCRPTKLSSIAFAEAVWSERQYAFQDLIEAFYAFARSGVSEGEAVELIGRAAGSRSWELLRTLQEATFVDARLRSRWRGRVFTLVHPALVEIQFNGSAPGVVVCGALPARLETDFRHTVDLQGGSPFRHIDPSSLAPPLLGAVNVAANRLAEALGWQIISDANEPEGQGTARLCETNVLGEGYQIASAWDWSEGGFRRGDRANSKLSLVRLMHPGGRDHDLYRVVGSDRRTFTSRPGAIVDLFSKAGRPLFHYKDGAIRRIPSEGALPIEIARSLRLKTLFNGGAATSGWEYRITRRGVEWLTALLPGLVEGNANGENDERGSYRRGRGYRRPVWINGATTG